MNPKDLAKIQKAIRKQNEAAPKSTEELEYEKQLAENQMRIYKLYREYIQNDMKRE